jgi:glycosyltransferase involved in cell wall biosynthesis
VSAVHLVLPSEYDDEERPSGGNAYDRRLVRGLRARGWDVRVRTVGGSWPAADARLDEAVGRELDAVPDGAVVIIDALVVAAAPAALVRDADRLRLVVLAHVADGLPQCALAAASRVVCPSEWVRRRLLARHSLAPDRVVVAAPGVEAAPVAPGSPSGGELLCVGALTAVKGQDVLIAALGAVAGRDWNCVLVGPLDRDPAFVAGLHARLVDRGLAGRIEFAGVRRGPALARSYAGADLLVVPSRSESYGMVVTEALARGVPVLASATGGVREALGRDGQGRRPGRLVAPDDPLALAAGLDDWLTDAGLRHELRAAALARRSGLPTWEATINTVAEVVTGAVNLA